MGSHEELSEEFHNYYRQPPGWLLENQYQDEWRTHCHTSEGEVEWTDSDGWRSRPCSQVDDSVDFNQEPLEHNATNKERKQIWKDKKARAEQEERELRAENRPRPQRRRRRTPK